MYWARPPFVVAVSCILPKKEAFIRNKPDIVWSYQHWGGPPPFSEVLVVMVWQFWRGGGAQRSVSRTEPTKVNWKTTKVNPVKTNWKLDWKIIVGQSDAQMEGNPYPVVTQPFTNGLALNWACSSMKKDNTSNLIKMASYPEAVHIAAICSMQWKMSYFHPILSMYQILKIYDMKTCTCLSLKRAYFHWKRHICI